MSTVLVEKKPTEKTEIQNKRQRNTEKTDEWILENMIA